MDTIDLRSDTVTHPTPAMRAAMANALVGDDVYNEDPTLHAIQDYAADLLGKEAALYLPTATMSNLTALLTHCARGEEVILSQKSHIYQYEQGGASALGGIIYHPLPVHFDGTLSLEAIAAAIRPDDPHFTRTRLICLENTVHGCGGTPITPDYTDAVGDLAHRHGLKLHIDGARLFNAAAALNVAPRQLVAAADSVQLCLSKGLCAPLGALLVGNREFIAQALRVRKVLGGGMRQAGVVAAAGLVALQDMRARLADDHHTAQMLAEGLAEIEGVQVEPVHIRTNMVFFHLPAGVDSAAFVAELKARNVILRGKSPFRLVTHYYITPQRVLYTLQAMREVLTVLRVVA